MEFVLVHEAVDAAAETAREEARLIVLSADPNLDAPRNGLRGSASRVRLTVSHSPSARPPLQHASGPHGWCVVFGSPIASQSETVGEVLQRIVEQDAGRAADELTALNGAFVAVHVDAEASTLTVVTDALGLQPLFHARAGARSVFASSIRGAAKAAGLRFEEDLAAIGSLLVLGHLIGDRTVHAGVRRVPPATVLRLRTGKEHRVAYWRLPTESDPNASFDEHVGEVERALRRWYHASLREYPAGTLFISGGFDSRVAAGLLTAGGDRPDAVTLHHRDENADADLHVASEVCRRLRLTPAIIDPRADFFDSDAYAEYIGLTEATTASLFLFIATLQLARSHVRQAAWDGLLLGFLNVAEYETGGFGPYLERLTAKRAALLESGIFDPAWIDRCLTALQTVIDEERSAWPDAPEGVLGFGLRNRARLRFAPTPVMVLGSEAPVHLPGATREFWETVSRIPIGLRAHGRMHVALLQRLAPTLTDLPVVSGTKILFPSPRAWSWGGWLRLRGAAGSWWRGRPRAQRYARRVGVRGGFEWKASARAFACIRRALDCPDVYAVDRLAALLAHRTRVGPTDVPLILAVARERGVSAVADHTQASEASRAPVAAR